MKYLVKINIIFPPYRYNSKNWEEKDISIPTNEVYQDIKIFPPVDTERNLKIHFLSWKEIQFKSIDDEQQIRKLSLIKSII